VRFVFITHRKTLVLNRMRVAGVLGEDLLARLRDYVLAHLDESIEVAALANLAGRNSFHFTRMATWSILNPLGFPMLSAGLLPGGKPVFTGTIDTPPKDHTAQYGEYVISYLDCRECHGRNLTGGIVGQLPPIGPDLNLVKDWRLEDFVTAMRSGVDPGGHELSDQMPWHQPGSLTPPARRKRNRHRVGPG
jgi:hypothetical protein